MLQWTTAFQLRFQKHLTNKHIYAQNRIFPMIQFSLKSIHISQSCSKNSGTTFWTTLLYTCTIKFYLQSVAKKYPLITLPKVISLPLTTTKLLDFLCNHIVISLVCSLQNESHVIFMFQKKSFKQNNKQFVYHCDCSHMHLVSL